MHVGMTASLYILCYVFHKSCWNNRGRLFLLLMWSSPVIHFCWIIFIPKWITGEASFFYWFILPLLFIAAGSFLLVNATGEAFFSYWFVLPLLFIWIVEEITTVDYALPGFTAGLCYVVPLKTQFWLSMTFFDHFFPFLTFHKLW